MQELMNQDVKTMSSLEIAELTDKRHDHVLRDIEKVLDEVGIDAPKFGGEYKTANNQLKPCYNLPYRECQLIISGYSANHRLAIIDRWQELEQQKPMSLTDRLRATADAIDKAAAEGIKAQGMVQALSERTTSHEEKTSRNFSKAKVVINKHDEEIIALKQTIAEIQANHKGIERCPMGYTVWSVLRRTLDKQISKEAWMAMFSHYSVSVENWDKPEAKAPGGIQPTPVYNIAEAKIAYDAWMADSAPSSKCFFTHDGSGAIFKYKDKNFPFIPSK